MSTSRNQKVVYFSIAPD